MASETGAVGLGDQLDGLRSRHDGGVSNNPSTGGQVALATLFAATRTAGG
jgi:hypothetical protein